jgi:hypothetical protein
MGGGMATPEGGLVRFIKGILFSDPGTKVVGSQSTLLSLVLEQVQTVLVGSDDSPRSGESCCELGRHILWMEFVGTDGLGFDQVKHLEGDVVKLAIVPNLVEQ